MRSIRQRQSQLIERGGLQLMDSGYADTEDFGNLRQVQLFHEVELDDQLQPLGQLADLLGEPRPVFLLQKDAFRVGFGSSEQARAVRITFLHRIEVDRRAVAAQLFELGKRQAQRGGGFGRFGCAIELHAQFFLGAFDAAALLARAARLGRGTAQQVHHRSAHAQLGIGSKTVFARPVVPLGAFGEGHEPGLHQIFDVERWAGASGEMPGKLSYHRQESRDAICDFATIGLSGRKAGMILNHAAKASLSNSDPYSGCGAASGSAWDCCGWSFSPPMTAITSIGWAIGSSLMEITRHPGARSLSSALIGRRARGWTTSAGAPSPGWREAMIAATRSPSDRARSGSTTT